MIIKSHQGSDVNIYQTLIIWHYSIPCTHEHVKIMNWIARNNFLFCYLQQSAYMFVLHPFSMCTHTHTHTSFCLVISTKLKSLSGHTKIENLIMRIWHNVNTALCVDTCDEDKVKTVFSLHNMVIKTASDQHPKSTTAMNMHCHGDAYIKHTSCLCQLNP